MATWSSLLDRSPSEHPEQLRDAWLSFCSTLVATAPPDEASDSAVYLRAALESFVAATNKAAADLEHVAEYRAWSLEDADARRDREAALRAAADRWRDE